MRHQRAILPLLATLTTSLVTLAACNPSPKSIGSLDGETNGETDGEPATCQAQSTEEACAATEPEPGVRGCAWVSVQTFSDVNACQVASTESRCISLWDQGAGCAWWSCDETNYYTRVGEAGTELFNWTPDTCGHEPFHEDGWRQCSWQESSMTEQWSEGQVCDCACGSPPSGTEP
jgi:hypothetical protein